MPKRAAPAFGQSAAKRQSTLPFPAVKENRPITLPTAPTVPKQQLTSTFSNITASFAEEQAPAIPSSPSCRFKQYVEAIVERHQGGKHYRAFFRKYNVDVITEKLRSYLTPSTLDVLDNESDDDLTAYVPNTGSTEFLLTLPRLLGIGGDTNFEGCGWYMNMLTDELDPTWYALYPVQTIDGGKRVRYHKTHYLTAKESLHYFTWKQPHKKSGFVLLGQLPASIEAEALMLNVVEQLLGTIFQALPEEMLPEYLPRDVQVRLQHRGLMVARPMQQSEGNDGKDSHMLYSLSNPTTLMYVNTHYKPSLKKGGSPRSRHSRPARSIRSAASLRRPIFSVTLTQRLVIANV
jgi:hypothetical protein